MSKAVLKRGREWPTVHLHPWIFSGSIVRVEGAPQAGDEIEVFSEKGDFLGVGAYSPLSQIRVRMLSFAKRGVDLAGMVAASAERRRVLLNGGDVTAVRLIHGESDGIPGVVADWYDGWIVVQLSTAWAESRKMEIASALMSIPGAKGVYNRSDVDSRAREGLPVDGDEVKGAIIGPEPPELIEVREWGMNLLVDPRNGHKTGFYIDQREARRDVAALSRGRRVLNAFSYTGAFGVAAIIGGAKSVVNLDLSEGALALAQRNLDINPDAVNAVKSGAAGFECMKADVFKALRRFRDEGRSFDLIVLDPPKFADTKAQLMRAARGYKDINLLAMKLLAPGGILATFSCSGAMDEEFFSTILREAAFDSGRDFSIIGRTRQAADHPVRLAFPEGLYLKGFILR